MTIAISLDDQLAGQVCLAPEAANITVNPFIAQNMYDALKRKERSDRPPLPLVNVRGGRPRHGVDLDRPRTLDPLDD